MTSVSLLPTAHCIPTLLASHSNLRELYSLSSPYEATLTQVLQERVAELEGVAAKIHFHPLLRGKVPISREVVNSPRLVTCRLSNYIDTSLSRGEGSQ